MRRIIIVGLDGVPFGLLEDLANSDIMPNTKKIISEGIFKKMQSSIPEVSSVAWSSIITGKNPGEHGIFGFTDFYPYSYNLRFPNFGDLKSSPFWTKTKGKSIIINVPATYPVKEMNGVHISGFVSVDFEKSVYPKSLIPKLKEFDYRLDVDSEIAHKSLNLFLEDLNKTLDARIQAYKFLWDYTDWQVFMFIFTETDRLMHFLWDAYEDKNHPYHKNLLECFCIIDKVIGEIKEKINNEDLLILLSDHGFQKVNKDVYINYLLKKEGFLNLEDASELSLEHIDQSTLAFALDPARIYINIKNKYPRGSVELRDKNKILKDLEDLFRDFEIDNEKVIKDIYRKETIYSGPFLDRAPDLILVGNRGFNLKADIKADKPMDKGIFTGKHTQEDAFLLINSKILEIVPEKPDVFCITDIIK